MCGFAGVIAFDRKHRVWARDLVGMSACIAHRGPDGQGVYLADHDPAPNHPQAALVHVRLAILDPDPRSDQPFQIGKKWIVFNGEIYNFRQLRAELDTGHPGYAWRTTGDTEVLLRAYDAWGERCLAKLDGMFAFAIWDEADGSLFLARDRMGQKPLYYAVAPGNGAVAFASELGALKNLSWPIHPIDTTALSHYLSWGYIPAPWTIYDGARKLEASSWRRFSSDGNAVEGRYYDVNAVVPSGVVSVESVRNAFRTAVHRQMISDVPVGCFLSGGIDSSITTSCMTRLAGNAKEILTFSIGFDDARYDETAFARQVAEHLGTTHHEFRVTPDAVADLPRLAEVFGEPFADSSALPTHYLARETRRFVKVALSGDGGDELFGGYDRYRAMRLGAHVGGVSQLLRLFSKAIPGSHPKSQGARMKRFARTLELGPSERYASYLRLFTPSEVHGLLRAAADDGAMAWLPSIYTDAMEGRDLVEAALATDRVSYLPEDLLTKVDRAAMLHALEVRSPFMDPDVLALAGTLRSNQLINRGGKRMLRQAFSAELPATVFKRRKMGFAVPIGEWFRTSLREMLHDVLFSTGSFAAQNFDADVIRRLIREHESRVCDHSQRLYALLMLELWWKSGG